MKDIEPIPPTVLCIAGLDPSGGAGLLADIKTLHQHKVQGFGIATAITYQNATEFQGLDWLSQPQIIDQITPLAKAKYPVHAIKIGIIQNLSVLTEVLTLVTQQWPAAPVVWDPVLRASAGYTFHQPWKAETLTQVLHYVYCLTPNAPEAEHLAKILNLNHLQDLSLPVNLIYKGGHTPGNTAIDTLYTATGDIYPLQSKKLEGKTLHGTGCAFSTALAAALAKNTSLHQAFAQAKNYVYQLLETANGPLGVHHYCSSEI